MISVVVATYNGGSYLKEQLDSIVNNLEGKYEYEIIVTDDGSTDDTCAIARSYECVRLVDGPGQGVIANFENGLMQTKGDVIFLSDQDDVWASDKVEYVMQILQNDSKTKLILHDAVVKNSDLSQTLMESFFDYRGSKAGVFANFVKNRYMGCCMAFRRELLEKVLPIPKDIPMHDQWIGILSDHYYGKSVLIKKPLLSYRRHENNASDFAHNSLGVMIKNRLHLWKLYRRRIKVNRGTKQGQ